MSKHKFFKPFDLNAASHGAEIICGDGTEAQFITYVPACNPGLVVLVRNKLVIYHNDGSIIQSTNKGCYSLDLFMKPEKKKVQVVISESGPHWSKVYFPGDEKTATDRPKNPAAIVELEYYEGQGLNE